MTTSRNPGPTALAELLRGREGPGGLTRLAREADRRATLADFLREILPPELKPALLACNFRDDGTLMLIAPNAAWAARLRFEAETLLARGRERLPGLTRLRVRVVQDADGTGSQGPGGI